MTAILTILAIFAAGYAGTSWWLAPIGALFLVDRSWHAQLAYRGRFSGAGASDVLPYATSMCVLQAGLTAAGTFALGSILGSSLAG